MTRSFVAGLVMMFFLLRSGESLGFAPRHWPRMLVVAVIGMGLNTVLWQNGLKLSTATNAALISSVSPIFALTMVLASGQETLVLWRLAGLLLAMGGVVLVIQTDGFSLSGANVLGDILILGCAVTWALYNVSAVPLLRAYSPLKVTAWAMLLGSASMAAFGSIGVQSWDTSRASLEAWGGLAFAITFGTVVAQTLWTRTVRSIGASATMIYSYLNPVLAVVFAAILLGETLSPTQAAGAALVLVGVGLSTRRRPNRQ
jgi:drug/metabolite transporter (DMT)-like permease